jgi:glycosyltransferase involved in cell wall biosynthesis
MYAASIPGVLTGRWAGVPVVVHVHNLHEWRRHRRIRTARRIWPYAARVAAISHSVRKSLLKECKLEPLKVVTLYNGVDLEHFAGPLQTEQERRRWGIESQELVVGSVSRLVPAKGLFDLLRAGAIVQKSHQDVCLVLVGGGDLRAELEQEANKLNLRIIFTGTQEDVRPLIGMFDLAVLSSHTEGFGIFLLEAMAFSKPVVATEVGGIPEVVAHGETGYLVPPGEPEKLARSILDLLEDDRMGLAGRQRVEKIFSLEKTLTNTCNMYQEILEIHK